MANNNASNQVNKNDLQVFLEVNRKAVEIETSVAEQNEEIISKLDKLIDKTEEINKDIFKIQVLFITGILSLVIQIVQIFVVKK